MENGDLEAISTQNIVIDIKTTYLYFPNMLIFICSYSRLSYISVQDTLDVGVTIYRVPGTAFTYTSLMITCNVGITFPSY